MRDNIIFNCDYCGKETARKESDFKRNKNHFCSKDCAYDFIGRKAKRVCEGCGVEFLKFPSELRKGNSDFCSRSCYDRYRRSIVKEKGYIKTNGVHIHRTIAENALGRKLQPKEIVHHIDGDCHNNAIQNLTVLPSQGIHATIHFSTKNPVNIDEYRLINIINMVTL